MIAIKGVYDGQEIKALETIPFSQKRNVIITFLEEIVPIEKKQNWRRLRGSAKGTNLTNALLKSRKEDFEREG